MEILDWFTGIRKSINFITIKEIIYLIKFENIFIIHRITSYENSNQFPFIETKIIENYESAMSLYQKWCKQLKDNEISNT